MLADARLAGTTGELHIHFQRRDERLLRNVEVRAPADGVVSKKSVEVGQVVQMGQPLLALVPRIRKESSRQNESSRVLR